MEPVFAILVGLFFAAAIYLMLSKVTIRIMLGIAILGNSIFSNGALGIDLNNSTLHPYEQPEAERE